MSLALKKEFGHAVIVKNQIPNAYKKHFLYFPLINQGQPLDTKYIEFKPSVGAFEISYDGNLLWSRLQSGQWPNMKELIDRTKKMIDGIEGGRDVSHLCFKFDKSIHKPKLTNFNKINLNVLKNPQSPRKSRLNRSGSRVSPRQMSQSKQSPDDAASRTSKTDRGSEFSFFYRTNEHHRESKLDEYAASTIMQG